MDYVLKYFFNKIFIQIFSGFLAKQSIKPATQRNYTNYIKFFLLIFERNYSNSF